MSQHLVIRSDGGWITTTRGVMAIASGHLMRMLALAKTWRSKTGPVTLVTHRSCQGVESFLARYRKANCQIEFTQSPFCDSLEDAEETARVAKRNHSPVFLDGYHFGSEYQERLRSHCQFLVVQDDTANQGPYAADMIVSGHVHATDLNYANANGARLLLGPSYALTSPELIAPSRTVPAVSHHLLVSLGSLDRFQDTERCLSSLLKLTAASVKQWLSSLEIAVVIGANYSFHQKIERLAIQLERAQGTRVKIYRDLDNLNELINWADIALSAAGGTILELLFAGIPSVLQISHVNQRPIARKLVELGLCSFAGDSSLVPAPSPEEVQIANGLFELSHNQLLRRQISERARLTFDGKGAERVCAAIIEEYRSHETSNST